MLIASIRTAKGELQMKTKNTCYTYFAIVGNFNPDQITELLGL